MHRPKVARAVRFGRAAPARADRIDQNEVGEWQPGVWIVDQTHFGAVMTVGTELGNARPNHPEIEKSGSSAGAAVENKSHRPRRGIGGFCYERRVENCRRAFAALV